MGAIDVECIRMGSPKYIYFGDPIRIQLRLSTNTCCAMCICAAKMEKLLAGVYALMLPATSSLC